jgi:hypothetical protein
MDKSELNLSAEESKIVRGVVDYSERDYQGGQRDWLLVDVDDGAIAGRQLWYRDRPSMRPWLYIRDADGCDTIDEALAPPA